MEISSDGYLHKKFKKQLNTDPMQITAKEQNIVKSCAPNTPLCLNNDTVPLTKNTNDIVPKFSTNNENVFLEKSSISRIGNSLENVSDGFGGLKNSQSFNNCISYVISNSDRVEDINQQDTPHRLANFDRRFNILETIAVPRVETSSILDNVYSKQYVTSKLVSVENTGDISSSANIASNREPSQELSCFEDSCTFDRNIDNQPLEQGIIEKSSLGKYVCSYCNLACSKPSVLEKHIRAHTNERPYPCLSCGFSFKTRSNLYKHCRSRTHANRVMGNKVQEIQIDGDSDSQSKLECIENTTDDLIEDIFPTKSSDMLTSSDRKQPQSENSFQDFKTKPYKPRFHTTKPFFDDKDNYKVLEDQRVPDTTNVPNSQVLSIHINDGIGKNNAVVNSVESIGKRSTETDTIINEVLQRNYEVNRFQNSNLRLEEPLNLTNKMRKRCISEVTEPTIQTSLIKELLLKNLYADPNMQCPHCKMIFQTVTELELHKLRSCKGFIKSGAKYTRSSSVNVASILTKNKNAFDTIPHIQNTIFPLKSPGPCLGKTQLVESDKNKSFGFDDSLPVFKNAINNQHAIKSSIHSSISPLTIEQERDRKMPVKLFGGEVQITQTSGEMKSYKIDNKDPNHYSDCSKLSENRVIKSSLHSGGTVLQNKYNSKQDLLSPLSNSIRGYETNLSPSIDITSIDKAKFNFDQTNEAQDMSNNFSNKITMGATPSSNFGTTNDIYNYTNIMDFSQKAAKLLAPNLKQPNLTIPGIPVPSKIVLSHSPPSNFETKANLSQLPELPQIQNEFSAIFRENNHMRHRENTDFAQNQMFKQQKNKSELASLGNTSNICNPLNLLVNGKVIRYVPGIPGPVAADVPLDVPYASIQTPRSATKFTFPETPPPPCSPKPENRSPISNKLQVESETISRSPKLAESKSNELQLPRLNELRSPNNQKSSTTKTLVTASEVTRKFTRPNTLALKPSTAAYKQHHGLTPTMFNQILISPDTPRVAKKYMQHFLHGNYFSYLGLKSSTKSVYCTLNKTQPFYVPHFKKLSMYSEWRQQETKADKLYASAYDSRLTRKYRYTTSGRASSDLVVHSSYKFIAPEVSALKEDEKNASLLGGYESNDDYTYIRGRGRGRYVCEQCGIRCKKPSMLKKHIRTHGNDRPYTCNHCNFSFKTKGNLTKHMKSKAHTKNYAVSGSSNSSTQQSGTQSSSDSDTDDSGMDSSDESTRQQEHEAAYGLLSLSQKNTQNIPTNSIETTFGKSFMNVEQVTQVNNTNFAKNKILDKQVTINFNTYNILNRIETASNLASDVQNLTKFLGKTNLDRPLTYPYTTDIIKDHCLNNASSDIDIANEIDSPLSTFTEDRGITPCDSLENDTVKSQNVPVVKVNDMVVVASNAKHNGNLTRKRVIQEVEVRNSKYLKTNTHVEAMDLSMTSVQSKPIYNGITILRVNDLNYAEISSEKSKFVSKGHDYSQQNGPIYKISRDNVDIISSESPLTTSNIQTYDHMDINYVMETNTTVPHYTEVRNSFSPMDYDNSAMETLADVATKQVKLEKHILAKNVASEFLKLTSKKDDTGEGNFLLASQKEVNDLLSKPEENKSCTICDKNFSKPSQLRLHMNIHYLERPFRCDPCSTSFRTKGHLQKHERSAGHHNKLTSPLLSSSEPRPFKCTDCSVGFRIHGHLAKHLRSKQHIMKLEWLAKIPIGLYAELERANSLLTEINTTDGDQCLESLQALARKVFISDTSKPSQPTLSTIADTSDI